MFGIALKITGIMAISDWSTLGDSQMMCLVVMYTSKGWFTEPY